MVFSKFIYQTSTRPMAGNLLAAAASKHSKLIVRQSLNKVPKRWSGHNAMEIEPSNWAYKKFKDSLHFYTLLGLIPVTVISTIVGIRANPELVEIPEGYEPRHWEYYKHPITRFCARYLFAPPDLDDECYMCLCERAAEEHVMKTVAQKVQKIMSFYNDHRSIFFMPYFAEPVRQGRDYLPYVLNNALTNEGHNIDVAYQPWTPIPVEGYRPGTGFPDEE